MLRILHLGLMKTIYKLAVNPIMVLLGFIAVFSACDKGNEAMREPMDLSGTVKLYTEDGLGINDSGMTVTIQNATAEAVTDKDGNFTFSNLEFGNYFLVFNKEGFGEHKRFADHPISDTPNVIPEFIRLGQKSTAEMVSLNLTLNGDILSLSAVSKPEATSATPRYFHIFFHDQPGVSNQLFKTFETRQFVFSPSNYNKSISFFYDSGFESGDEIFIAVYTTSKYDNVYYDPNVGNTIFPNLNPETVEPVSFILP